jgi:hypothetical protein
MGASLMKRHSSVSYRVNQSLISPLEGHFVADRSSPVLLRPLAACSAADVDPSICIRMPTIALNSADSSP